MVAAAEHALESLSIEDPEVQRRKRKRRGWAPDDTDHLVYKWVKFDGMKQGEAAKMLGVDQSTVSRIVMRYEKWQAHATPATDGRLSPEERRRAQRWLTYERNEQIVASALRLAGEMERSIDASRSVLSRSGAEPSAEQHLKTEYFVVDRTQMASRFLRLAQKVGMDNLKLTEQEPLPELAPLADEEIAEQEAAAAAAAREREAAQAAASANVNDVMRERVDAEVAQAVTAAVERRMKEMDRERLAVVRSEAEVADAPDGERDEAGASRTIRPRQKPGTEPNRTAPVPDLHPAIRPSSEPAIAEIQVHNLHKMHTSITPKTGASPGAAGSCERQSPPTNIAGRTCIPTANAPPGEAGASRAFLPSQPPETELSTRRERPDYTKTQVVGERYVGRPESMRVVEPGDKDGLPSMRWSEGPETS
jgi:transposase